MCNSRVIDNAGTETHRNDGWDHCRLHRSGGGQPLPTFSIDVANGPGPKISWTPFVDAESQIHFYKVSLGTTPGAGQAQRTTHTWARRLELVVTQPVMEFQDGRDYYATVVAQNRAGLQTMCPRTRFDLTEHHLGRAMWSSRIRGDSTTAATTRPACSPWFSRGTPL